MKILLALAAALALASCANNPFSQDKKPGTESYRDVTKGMHGWDGF